jgi:RNA polymerase primary sigma factor
MSRDSIQAYLNEIGRYPLLTKAQEVSLGTQIQAWVAIGEKKEYTDEERRIQRVGMRAKAKFISCNLRLVVNIARKYARFCNTLDFMDLIQEGNLGLVRAIEKFDPTRGYAFSTYAYWWIRQSIQRSIQTNDYCIRLPIGIHEAMHKIKKVNETLTKQLGREPTIQEIAISANIKIDDVKTALNAPTMIMSLDKTVNNDEGGGAIIDIIPDHKNSNTIEDAESRINIADAYMAIDRYLDEQTKYVVLERSKDPPTSWKELAIITGVSKGKLQTMEKEGLRRCALLLAIKNKIEST